MAEAFHALGEFHESSEAGQAADPAVHRIAHLVILEVALPGVGLQLLDAQREAVRRGIDIQNHRLHDHALLQNFAGMLDALGPGEIADVHQAVDALFDLDEGAEIGHVADAAFHHAAHAVAAVDGGPGVGLELLQAERNAAVLGMHLEHHGFHLIARP